MRGMLGSLFRFVVSGLLMFGMSAAIGGGEHAAAAGCPRKPHCPDEYVDGDGGCCLEPQGPELRADEKRAAEKRAAGEKRAADEKRAAEDKRAADEKRAAEERRTAEKRAAEERRAAEKRAAEKRAAERRAADASKIGIPMLDETPATCPDDMVHVPGGSFLMGSPPDVGEPNEHPQHQVTLSGYCIDRTEVTVAMYTRCVADGTCTPAKQPGQGGQASSCNGSRADRQDHPVNCIDWNQATAYCASVNKRLPSEPEWEYAARGPEAWTYPWGNDPPAPDRLNACGAECRPLKKRLGLGNAMMYNGSDSWEGTAPVGSFLDGASRFGALDMAGNVGEWTADDYLDYTGRASHFQNGVHRVIRGGTCMQAAVSEVRGASRFDGLPGATSPWVGFRCARQE
jgi:formylglycine-generating enzyme required for sulfatase activity